MCAYRECLYGCFPDYKKLMCLGDGDKVWINPNADPIYLLLRFLLTIFGGLGVKDELVMG